MQETIIKSRHIQSALPTKTPNVTRIRRSMNSPDVLKFLCSFKATTAVLVCRKVIGEIFNLSSYTGFKQNSLLIKHVHTHINNEIVFYTFPSNIESMCDCLGVVNTSFFLSRLKV